ncbi:MAG: 7-cyano-7-deazaguanine synthase QueC [Rickettsiales bacterium]|jgi:7-cyano-7-deazaguanine synthase|nr:7-cyano-7-deazaguanine synthase QueC [Rickettsiales bacterium]
MKKALILLSGGLDSATTAAMAIQNGYEIFALSFDYNQSHKFELESAKNIVKFLNIPHHKIIKIDSGIFQNSALTNDIPVPKNQEIDPDNNIPVTYVPARNILFLSYATAYAESFDITEIFIGANSVDYSGYPDCRPEFIQSFNEMINIGTKIGIEKCLKIQTPLIHLTKKDIIQRGLDLNFDYSLTISCYDPDNQARSCGTCDSCQIRLRAFKELGKIDNITYVT